MKNPRLLDGMNAANLLLHFIGETKPAASRDDSLRPGLRETPERFAKAWEELTAGYEVEPASVLKTFDSEGYNELILVRDIPVYSMCEHHLLPFFGVAHIGYIPKGKIVGLSKLPRLVEVFMRRLQVQERLTKEIAGALLEAVDARAVGVVLECRHMCMEARGISVQGAVTTTSTLRGDFMGEGPARAEFLSLINNRRV